MARVCTVCSHPQHHDIDKAILRGDSHRDIAGRYGLSKSAVYRHAQQHLPAKVVQAEQEQRQSESNELREELDEIKRHLRSYEGMAYEVLTQLRVITKNATAEDAQAILAMTGDLVRTLRELRQIIGVRGRLIDLEARITQIPKHGVGGEHPISDITINLITHPQWLQLKERLLGALEPYPDARKAVYEAMTHANGNG